MSGEADHSNPAEDCALLAAQHFLDADSLDFAASRLTARVSTSIAEYYAEIRGIASALASCRLAIHSCVSRLRAHHSLWFDKHLDELDSNEKLLTACAGVCDFTGVSLFDVAEAVSTISRLSSSPTLPRLSSFLLCPFVALELCSRVQCGPFVCESAGVGSQCCALLPHRNTVTLSWKDEVGEGVRGILPADVTLTILDEVSGALLDSTLTCEDSVGCRMACTYTAAPTPPATVTSVGKRVILTFALCRVPALTTRLAVGRPIEGTRVGVIEPPSTNTMWSLALSPDLSELFLSHQGSSTIHVYGTQSGNMITKFGSNGKGPGQFNWPARIETAPNGNLLVAEFDNARVQEVTLRGVHVRYFGVSEVAGREPLMRGVYGVSTWADTLIVCTRNGPMFVFDWHTGTLVRSFGGSGPNKLAVATCARVSPDGLLYVCEVDVPRVSVWSPVTGDFLHEFGPSVGFSRPMSIGFSPDGHIIVGDSVVYVVSKEGAVVNRLTGEGALCLMSPYDTVVAGGKLYMLEHANGRVQVFE